MCRRQLRTGELRRELMPICGRQFYTSCRASTALPGSDSAIETAFNNFMTALQALSTSPDSALGAQLAS